MSTLRVNNITDTSGGSSSLSVPGAAKAWVNFNGTGTVAIRAQLNVSSITDNGTADYTVNFANALTDANYSYVASATSVGVGDTGSNVAIVKSSGESGTATTYTTSAFRLITGRFSSQLADMAYVSVAIFR